MDENNCHFEMENHEHGGNGIDVNINVSVVIYWNYLKEKNWKIIHMFIYITQYTLMEYGFKGRMKQKTLIFIHIIYLHTGHHIHNAF